MKSEDIESYARRCGQSMPAGWEGPLFLGAYHGEYINYKKDDKISRRIIRDALLENKEIHTDTQFIFGRKYWAGRIRKSVRKYLKKFLDE